MSKYVALLRGINVGGHNRIGMADLRAMLESLGHTDVKTLLLSGNAVIESSSRSAAAIEKQLEEATRKRFRLDIDYFVRGAKEWATIVAANPFPKMAESDPSHLLVMCFDQPLKSAEVDALRAAIVGSEVVEPVGRELYLQYPSGIGTSKLTNTLIEKKLGQRGTARNWNTVLKLKALL